MVKRGRKPKPASERRRQRIMLNLTDAEYALLAKAAGGEYHATVYAREVVVRHLERANAKKKCPM